MRRTIRACRVLFAALLLLSGAVLLSSAAWAADYADGTYTVPFSMEGMGRHNVAWSTATVHVEGDALYVDFTVERIDPRDHAPQYDWIRTSLGTVTPVLNDENYTCSFYRVPVANLGRVDVTVQSSGMSQPYEIDYTLVIDGSSIPAAAAPEPSAEPTPEPSAGSTPAPSAEPTPEPSSKPTPEPSAEPSPEPSTEPSAAPSEAPEQTETPSPSEAPKATETSAPAGTPIPATGSFETLPEKRLGTGAIALIVVAAVLVVGGGVALALRKKK